jgi:hypothetical protein
MKKTLIVALAACLVGSAFVAPAVAKKKKKKPAAVQVDQKFFLRDTDGCDSGENLLSVTDGPDSGCWYVDSGPLYDAIVGAGLLTPADLGQTWSAMDGVPVTLDATKPITGEISTSSGTCVVDGGCSPAQLGGGVAILDVWVFADGEEIGTFSETFPVTPAGSHTSAIEIKLDPSLDKVKVNEISVLTYLHGAAVGHGVIELENPASFITLPTWK